MPPSSFFDRLGRAISAGIREFQNQNTATKDVPPSNDMKSWDRGSRIRAQEARDKKHPIPLEGIEGRDKWLRENLPRDVAERVITVLGSNPEDDFNSIDALMSISSRFVGEERKFDYKPTEAQYKGNYFTRLEEKFVMKVGVEDGSKITGKIRKVAATQSRDIVARAMGFCCDVKYCEWRYYKVLIPDEWHCCRKEAPTDWELTWIEERAEEERAWFREYDEE